MATFQQRAPRLDFSFPLEFVADGARLRGNCLNISESGLLGNFHPAPELWTTGSLVLRFADQVHELPARVARLDGNEAGMVFRYRHDEDRQVVRRILDVAEGKTQLVGPPPF